MSFPVVPEPRTRTPLGLALLARGAVALAWCLIRLPPGRLRRVLAACARGARPATEDQALRSRRAVVSVSRRCAGQGCLQRSVATVLLCRVRGHWPDWCTGVRTQPFRAHAWVEVDRRPVGESDNVRLFRTLLRVPAPTAHRRDV
ncbi:lasso peptide biosynthesis B2 protein [Streptomyces sp. PRKS01-65]|nr:lasso peptide biosynthesis B2 protein [Streptomyces harenosi]NEY34061.1 lasso peptide biosynthesis B2 protein [Streptomyces harenosi]